MKRLISNGMLMLSIVCSTALVACNTNQIDQKAPSIVGKAWIGAEGKIEAPTLDARWTLVEFFSPT
jgi:hypothetical protein